MAELTKTEVVLRLIEGGGDWRDFTDFDDDSGSETVAVSIASERFEEMGCPEKVTVTIEPGDRLNDA
jgi:hypothetical protein